MDQGKPVVSLSSLEMSLKISLCNPTSKCKVQRALITDLMSGCQRKLFSKVASSSSVPLLRLLQRAKVNNFSKVWLDAERRNEREACQACETPARRPTLGRCFQTLLPRLCVRSNRRWSRELFSLSQCTAETRRRSCFLRKF